MMFKLVDAEYEQVVANRRSDYDAGLIRAYSNVLELLYQMEGVEDERGESENLAHG